MMLNPNFLAYAASRGMTADEVMAADEQEYPGGSMTGFILWIAKMKQQFYRVSPQNFFSSSDRRWKYTPYDQIEDYAAWEQYLQEQAVTK